MTFIRFSDDARRLLVAVQKLAEKDDQTDEIEVEHFRRVLAGEDAQATEGKGS